MELTIGSIIEKISQNGKKETVSFLYEYAKAPNLTLANIRSYVKYVDNIHNKYKDLKKNINKKDGHLNIESYTSQNIVMPKPSTTPQCKGKEKSENIIYLQNSMDTLKTVSIKLASELGDTKKNKMY